VHAGLARDSGETHAESSGGGSKEDVATRQLRRIIAMGIHDGIDFGVVRDGDEEGFGIANIVLDRLILN
jgi:hypothetical protein